MRHIIPISGKDSLATAIWQMAHKPELPYEFVFNDTRAELPDVYDWLERIERTLGITIIRLGKSLEHVIDGYGILPSARVRFCTKDSKIRPMNKFIGKETACCYFGLRADEPERGGAFETKYLKPIYPLRDANIGLAMVYRIVEMRDLLPPTFFWKRLYDEVIRHVGDSGKAAIDAWPVWLKNRVFAWRSRPNCYFCFFQRRYEWVGLLEHHPRLFDKAERIEIDTGGAQSFGREVGFYWIDADYPLSKIREKADEIFGKRVDAVCKLVESARQMDLFQDQLDEIDIAGTSCGLLCGK